MRPHPAAHRHQLLKRKNPPPPLRCRTYPMCYAPLPRSAQSSFAPLQKSRWNHRSYVNRSPNRYGFRSGAKATRYSLNIAWIWMNNMWARQNTFHSLNTASLIAKKSLRKAILKTLIYISLICAIPFIWRIIENTTSRCWILQKGSVVMNVEDFHRWGVTNSMKVLLKSKTAQSVLNTEQESVARQWS